MTQTTNPASQDLIVPVILCGGSGTRLWPASRENYPKQFLSLLDDFSLLQNTLRRALRITGAPASSVVFVTTSGMENLLREQISEIDVGAASHILCEPAARNTAAAVALAADYIAKSFGPEAILWVLPSDHHIGRESALAASFQYAIEYARAGRLSTFGIKPLRADTGYGYIRTGNPEAGNFVFNVEQFVEKPDQETAERYLADERYCWNSGMFVFSAGTVLEDFETYAPQILAGVRESVKSSAQRPDADSYAKIPSHPFDKAIMEKAGNAVVIPCNPLWSDVGSWESLWDISDKDTNGNVIDGRAITHNAENCLVQVKDRLVAISGLSDIVVIETDDALLLSSKTNHHFKDMVNALKQSGASEIMDAPPAAPSQAWSMVQSLDEEKGLHAREVSLQPGQHKIFAGSAGFCLYTVLEGTADITVGGALHTVKPYQSLSVETISGYTITNPGASALKMIEVRKTAAEGVFFGTGANTRKVA